MTIDIWKLILFGLLFFVALLLFKISKKKETALPFSTLRDLPEAQSPKLILQRILPFLFWASFVLLGIAFMNPRKMVSQEKEVKDIYPQEGIAFYLLIDCSGSMADSIHVKGQTVIKNIWAKEETRDFIQGATKKKLKGRASDEVALIGFARGARTMCPPTLDKQVLLNRLKALTPVTQEDDDGTAIGYAIFKTVNQIEAAHHFAKRVSSIEKKPAYTTLENVIVVITDGLQSPNPLDLNDPYRFMTPEEALDYAAQNGIKVYYIAIEPDEDRDAFINAMNRLKKKVEETQGEFFLSSGDVPFDAIFEKIDEKEKSRPLKKVLISNMREEKTEKSYAPFFIGAGLSLLFIAIFLETFITKKIP